MIAFEVWLNGEKICLAGIGEYGVLSQHLDWVQSKAKADSKEEAEPVKTRFSIGGLVNKEHVRWTERNDLEIGDEVTIKIVEAESVDEPSRRKRSESGEERAQKVRDGLASARASLPSPLIEGEFLASLRGSDELLAAGEPEMCVKVLDKLGDLNECAPNFWEALLQVADDLAMYDYLHEYKKKTSADDE